MQLCPNRILHELKSCPFLEMSCQGIPRGLVRARMSERRYGEVYGWLLVSEVDFGSLKKTKSSTHLMTGAMPWRSKMHTHASAIVP